MTGIQKKKVDYLADQGYEFFYYGEGIVKMRKFYGTKINLAVVDSYGRVEWTSIPVDQKER